MASISESQPFFESHGTKQSKDAAYIKGLRPWHSLYGVRLCHEAGHSDANQTTNAPPLQTTAEDLQRQLSLIESLLPNEMLIMVLQQLPISALGVVQCVCRQWRSAGQAPSLWRAACMDAFAQASLETNERLLRQYHHGCWRDMFLDRAHLNFHGVYVARNTYVRTGATEWRVRNPVHLVAYFRYCRFLPDGSFVSRISPEPVGKVARSLLHPPPKGKQPASKSRSPVQWGRYKLNGNTGLVYTALRYDNSKNTEIRTRLRLRSTVRGANNRLDIESIVSYDREDGSVVPMAAPSEAEVEDEGVERRQYSRGMSSYVFVPWEKVHNHVLNKSVEEMDVYIPG